ncbi:MAG: hypothetical protein EHM18_03515 [Acidobacteria bacterium]|nr:MAG: hypothetical protein EHM18_03515 [Acidobacteriota bacterium]
MKSRLSPAARLFAAVPIFASLVIATFGEGVELINVNTSGTFATGGTSQAPSVSPDGRFVVFASSATDLTDKPPAVKPQVYLRDRGTGHTRRISMGTDGKEANGASDFPVLSGDGKWVVFYSWASNLVTGDSNSTSDVFLFSMSTGAITRVSVASGGAQGNKASAGPSLSHDGHFVAFTSQATNLVPGDANGTNDVFVHDNGTGSTRLVSVDSTGKQTTTAVDQWTSISGDGRFVAFVSRASDLVAGDTNNLQDVYLHDNTTGETSRISAPGGAQANHDCVDPHVSADGRYIAFSSRSDGLIADDRNQGGWDIFLYDRIAGTLRLVSQPANGTSSSGAQPCLSEDGRLVGYVAGPALVTDTVTGETLIGAMTSEGKSLSATTSSTYKNFYLSANGRFLVCITAGSAMTPTRIYLSDLFARGRIFPQFVNGQGNKTRVVLRNTTNQQQGGQIKFRDGNGLDLSIPVSGQMRSAIDYSVPAFGVLDLETDGTGPLAIGSLEVTSDRGIVTGLDATEIFQIFGKQVSVDACPVRWFHSLYVSVTGQENTGVAVFNPTKQPMTLEVNLFQDTTELATAQLDMTGEQQVALFVDNQKLFGQYLAGKTSFKGYLTIQPLDSKVVAAIGLIQRKATSALIAVPTSPYTRTIGGFRPVAPVPVLTFPHYANGLAGGAPNRTRLIMRGTGGGGNLDIYFKNQTGAPATVNLAGQSGSSFRFPLDWWKTLDLETNGLGSLQTGTIQVSSSAGKNASMQGVEVFEILGNYVSVENCPARPVHQVYVSYSPQENTGVAVYNPEATAVTLTLRLVDSTGVEVGTRTLTLASENQRAIFVDDPSLFATRLGGITATFRGTLNMTVNGGKNVSVIGLVQKRADGALLAIRTGAAPFAP